MSISDQLTRRITQIDAWIVQVLDIMLMVQMANKENKSNIKKVAGLLHTRNSKHLFEHDQKNDSFSSQRRVFDHK